VLSLEPLTPLSPSTALNPRPFLGEVLTDSALSVLLICAEPASGGSVAASALLSPVGTLEGAELYMLLEAPRALLSPVGTLKGAELYTFLTDPRSAMASKRSPLLLLGLLLVPLGLRIE